MSDEHAVAAGGAGATDAAGGAAPRPLYAILAVYAPCSALVCLLTGLGPLAAAGVAALASLPAAPALPYGAWYGAGFLACLGASAYCALTRRSTGDHAAGDIRGAVAAMLAAYGLGSLAPPPRLAPSLWNLPSALIALFAWFSCVAVNRIFAGRELFEAHAARCQGELLRQRMLEDAALMSEADQGLRRLIRLYGAMLGVTTALLLGRGIARLSLSPAEAVVTAALFVAGVCLIGFLAMLRREHVFAAEGMALGAVDRALPPLAMGLFALAAAGAAALLSSSRSVLSPLLIVGFFRWLAHLLEGLFKPVEAAEAPPMAVGPAGAPAMGLPAELLEALGTQEPSRFWDYVKYAAVALAAGLFVWFMIYPLLSRRRASLGGRSALRVLGEFLARWFGALGRGLRGIGAALRAAFGAAMSL